MSRGFLLILNSLLRSANASGRAAVDDLANFLTRLTASQDRTNILDDDKRVVYP
jgi:hypothetical protein